MNVETSDQRANTGITESIAPEIAVIHLVRAGNPPAALASFLDSYIVNPAGVSHRLVFLLKGFDEGLPNDIAEQLDRVPHHRIYCSDRGYDIASYFDAAARLTAPLLMFINSFSVLQCAGWLLKLQQAYSRDGVAVVGATGSWETLSLDASKTGITHRLKQVAISIPLRLLFKSFPNPHLRTNGFFLARTDFLRMRPLWMRTKLSAWLFESGRNSMTRQLLRRGLDVLVVGKDGSVYRPEQWADSGTFWQSQQENLLIQDNRTLAYERGSSKFQEMRQRAAWYANNTPIRRL